MTERGCRRAAPRARRTLARLVPAGRAVVVAGRRPGSAASAPRPAAPSTPRRCSSPSSPSSSPHWSAIGAPWRRLGLAGGDPEARRPARPGRRPPATPPRAALVPRLRRVRPRRGRRLARARRSGRRRRGTGGWRSLEAVSLLVFGLGLWLELVASPPLDPAFGLPAPGGARRVRHVGVLDPRLHRPACPTTASTATSTTWPAASSAAADQQIASAVLWFVAAALLRPR